MHFKLECPTCIIYSEVLKLHIERLYYWKDPNMVNFIGLVKSENENFVRNSAKLIRAEK